MRFPARKGNKGLKSHIHSVPAPVGGLNTLDSIAEMDSKYAVILQNFIPTSSSVDLRKGNVDHVTGIVGKVETLVSYNNGTTSKLFSAITDKIYDVTAAGAVGAAVASGKTNGKWQCTNFATTGGQYLYMFNGSDSPMLYDGATWTAITGVSTPAITGVTTSNLISPCVFQNRLWMIEKNSMKAWYLSSASIGGIANVLDLSSIFGRGGYLMQMGDWTIDSGSGVDDYAVFISSEGEVAVYRGTDPASASTWALVGVYYVGSPVGRRCMTKFASDLLMINQDGLQLMSAALSSSRAYISHSVTDKIQPTITEAVTTYGANFGFEILISAKENVLLINIPTSAEGTPTKSIQLVMNTITKGWCKFTGWNASTFEIMNDIIYYATDNGIKKCFYGTSDSGVAIDGQCLQAFNKMGTENIKHFKMARPILAADQPNIGVLLNLNVDYDVSTPTGVPTFTSVSSSTWGSGTWGVSLWGSSARAIRKDWQTAGNVGSTGALYLKTQTTTSQITWASTTYVYEIGNSYF